MDECGHTRLQLWSGGYYLACADCHTKWVAIKGDGTDRDVDHHARFGDSIQPLFEYFLKPTRRS